MDIIEDVSNTIIEASTNLSKDKYNALKKAISIEDNEICLGFHVIVAYGVNIPVVSENLMDSVRYQVEEFTGMKIKKIDIFVEGVRVID